MLREAQGDCQGAHSAGAVHFENGLAFGVRWPGTGFGPLRPVAALRTRLYPTTPAPTAAESSGARSPRSKEGDHFADAHFGFIVSAKFRLILLPR